MSITAPQQAAPCFWTNPVGRSLDCLLRHLPTGPAWDAWRYSAPLKSGKPPRAYRMMFGIARAFEDAWAMLCTLAQELNPYTTVQMIGEWEKAVGLPDACLWAATTLQQRRMQVIYRLSKRRWTTKGDWTDLARLFGLQVVILPGNVVHNWNVGPGNQPPLPLLGRFRTYINVGHIVYFGYDYGVPLRGPGYPVPYGFQTNFTNAYQCIIDRIRPANTVVLWNNIPPPLIPPTYDNTDRKDVTLPMRMSGGQILATETGAIVIWPYDEDQEFDPPPTLPTPPRTPIN